MMTATITKATATTARAVRPSIVCFCNNPESEFGGR
jgi:hypothetical protein